MNIFYILHTAAPGFVSRSIRWVTGTKKNPAKSSHSLAVYWSEDMSSWATLEALNDGILPRPISQRLDYLKSSTVSAHSVKVSPHRQYEILSDVLKRAGGVNYDFLLGFGWIFAGIGNRIAGRDAWVPLLNSKKRQNCSEFLSTEFARNNVPGFVECMHPDGFRAALDRSAVCQSEDVGWVLRILEDNRGPGDSIPAP